MSARVEKMLKDTMATTRNIIEKVRPPPTRGLERTGEEEDVGLTTGKAVPRWGVQWVLLACCFALFAGIVGLVAGILIVRNNLVDTDPYLRLIPFVNIPDAPLNFLVVGDWGRDGQFNQTLNALAMGKVASQLAIDFVVSTGDNFYNDGLKNISDPQFTTSFTQIYSAPSLQRAPWFAVLGNHDYHGDPTVELDPALRDRDKRWNCEKNYRRRHKACPKAQTSFCHYSLEFMFIDTSPLIESYWDPNGPEPLNFTGMADRDHGINIELNMLRDGLESSDATWKVVVGHHPVFSTGEHGSIKEMQEYILPQLKKFGVDIYMNGHDHNLELIQVPDVDTIFVTSGAGSQTRPERNGEVPGTTLFYHDMQGFVSVSVQGPTLDLRYYDVTGSVIYNVTLTKEGRRR